MKKNTEKQILPEDIVDNPNIIDLLYKSREESCLTTLSALEDKKLSDIKHKSEEDYYKLLVAIKNLPPQFNHCREIIFEALDQYLISQSLLSSYEYEYFYKSRL